MSRLRPLKRFFSSATKCTAPTSSAKKSPAGDNVLINYLSSLNDPSASVTNPKTPRPPKPPSPARLSSLPSRYVDTFSSDSEDTANQTSGAMSLILADDSSVTLPDSEYINSREPLENASEPLLFLNVSNQSLRTQRKNLSRERKQKWIFNNGHGRHFQRIVDSCALRLGTDATLTVFGKLGRETGVKGFNALLNVCIEKARATDDETVANEQLSEAFEVFMFMKEQGFAIEEETYGQVLFYLIDMGMVEQFYFFANVIKDADPCTFARLGYYEMLLYTRVNDGEKVQEFCDYILTDDGDETISLRENYLVALCESDQKENMLQLFKIVDITQISSWDNLASIFQSLGRLSLESHAEKFLLALKGCGDKQENISTLIFIYSASIPNLAVEEVVLKSKRFHTVLEITPSSTFYTRLIEFSCDLLEVNVAVDLVDEMCKAGLSLGLDTIHSLLNAIEESFEFNMVQRVYSLICHYNLERNAETFRSLISLSVKMKDFGGAYGMMEDMKKLNVPPTAGIYNAIIGGYFREKNIIGAFKVLKQMEIDNVKPDSATYSLLIGNCSSEEKITEYFEELKDSKVQLTKHVFMALINAFASCGQFEKAKQVLLDKNVPVKNLNEIKSVLVSVLASHGKICEALEIYEEIMEAGFNLEPKAAICLIEHLQCEEELGRVLELLEELHDPLYFVDGCNRALAYCIRNKHLRYAVGLLKQMKDRFCHDELAMDGLFDEVFFLIAETEPVDLEIGMGLLQALKDELGVIPSRKSLDFLLNSCIKAKDLRCSLLIWKEYQSAGLPYNVTNYLRMYHALLASGGIATAKTMLENIPRDDPHVCVIIDAMQKTYGIKSVKDKTKGRKANAKGKVKRK